MNEDIERPLTRRELFQVAAGWGAFLLGTASIAAATGRFLYPNVLYEPSRKYKVGQITDYPKGTITLKEELKLFILSTDEGIHAISSTCTHLGCIVKKTEEGFHCPCHGSRFDEAGNVTGGPAPKALPWFKVGVATDGQLVVDAAKTVSQGTLFKV